MHRPAFLGRRLSHLRLSEPSQQSRVFSTTPARFFPDDSDKPQDSRQRAAAAAALAGNLPSRQVPRTDGPRTPSRGGAAAPGVISLKSLPKRGSKFPGPGVSAPRFQVRRTDSSGEAVEGADTSGRGGFRGRGRGGAMRGRGKRGRGGRGRGRGGRGGRSRDDDEMIEDDDDADMSMPTFTPKAALYLDSLENMEAKVYTPKLSEEDLIGYGPAVASTGNTNKAGRTEGVLRNLRLLGGGVPFCGDVLSPETVRADAKAGKGIFFDRLEERQFAKGEDGRGYPMPGEEIKKVVLEAAVSGKYAAVKPGKGNDPVAMMERYFAKQATYRPDDVKSQMEKFKQLVR